MTTFPLIPRHVLFDNPDHASPQISKDGRYLAYLAPWEGVLNIWYYDVLLNTQPQSLTHDKGRGIRAYGWAGTNSHIVYIQDTNGDEDWQIFVLEIAPQTIRCLTPEKAISAQIVASSIHYPHEMIVGINHRNPELHDYYRINILTGERTLVLENPGFAGVEFDNNLDLRFATKINTHGGLTLLLFESETWKPFEEIDPQDALTTSIVGFTADNRSIYLLDSRGSNTSVLKVMEIATKTATILAHDTRADGSDFLMHPSLKTPQAYGVNYLRKSWQFFDPRMEEDFRFLETITDGDVEIVSRTHDDQVWVVGFLQDKAPMAFYLFERITRSVTFLFVSRSRLANYPLQAMEALEIPARDGLPLVCYVTKPVTTEIGPAPFILHIHGGPRARDSWGFDAVHQWLANRGYGVISINYRGSMGFGKSFMNKGNGEWARAMHDDIIDVAEWAIAQGLADRQRLGIMGGSYGGYAVLVGLTMTPDYFACGIDLVGVSNLETFVTSIPPYWRPVRDVLKVMLGTDFDTEEGKAFLRERSPLTYHHHITKPLLIAHGANDPRVRQSESDQLVSALQEKKIPALYGLYPDEGHGFARPQNRLSFYAITEAFLAHILRGHCEPVGNDFEGSSLQIMAGKEYIEDLITSPLKRVKE